MFLSNPGTAQRRRPRGGVPLTRLLLFLASSASAIMLDTVDVSSRRCTSLERQVLSLRGGQGVADPPQRHCSFCLLKLKGGDEGGVACGGCERRFYCSEECKKKDWSKDGIGQGHEGWCGKPYGEEDEDWEVRHISDEKGMGVVALRDMPRGFMIMVSGELDKDQFKQHPAAASLAPINGTLEDKFATNALDSSEGVDVVCPRISRVNHNCTPNAFQFAISGARAIALFAERDIAKGEELSLSYVPYNDVCKGIEVDGEVCRAALRFKYGVKCPEDCQCQDEAEAASVAAAKMLYSDMKQRHQMGDLAGALHSAEELLGLGDKCHMSSCNKVAVLFFASVLAVRDEASFSKAKAFSQQCKDVNYPASVGEAQSSLIDKVCAAVDKASSASECQQNLRSLGLG